MTETLARPDSLNGPTRTDDFVDVIRDAGIAGAGGAGFPSYSKWTHLDDVDALLMNHQESEPNYFIDKWLGQEHPAAFAALFDTLLDSFLDVVVVGAKRKDRAYLQELEALTDGTVRLPADLPLDPAEESGVVFAYTDSTYQYGMESVLLNVVADTVIGDDLPMDHGWIVQNTETLYNISQAWTDRRPVTRTHVHVGGEVPDHRFLDVPIGTPLRAVLDRAYPDGFSLPSDAVLVSGGPGWCFPIEAAPETASVCKHTNGLMVLDAETVEQNTFGGGRIDVLESYDWTDRQMETEPTATVDPDVVRLPLLTNPDLSGVVQASTPLVGVGDSVTAGERVAAPTLDGVSLPQHASIDGTVTAVEESHITIRADRP
jgi:electron transport complex protein RnfC